MTAWSIAVGEVTSVLAGFQDASFDALLCDPPYGLRFMAKAWDYDVPSVELWRECLRVLKPGAPLVAFGGSRTYHRLACRIEDAGFELRDCLMWLYGKGFPKSLNMKEAWQGYGTALKPAHEPIVLGRRPVEKTLTANVLKYGVGGLAIDACRIEVEGGGTKCQNRDAHGQGIGHGRGSDQPLGNTFHGPDTSPDGRWPANLILDEEAGALLDASVAPSRSVPYPANTATGNVLPFERRPAGGYSDSGGPSRFFYCSKVSTKEREAGCEGLAMKSACEATEREDGSIGLDNPRTGANRTGGARNHHPTLKPLSLTTWLARLIMPPAPGVILVPFAGAGSEMIGCLKAGWSGVFGIEREEEYATIARARLRHWCPESEAA